MSFLDALRHTSPNNLAVLAHERRLRAAQQAADARQAVEPDLARLAELSDHMSPLEAAQQLFGSPQ